jgi:hypothetical protein
MEDQANQGKVHYHMRDLNLGPDTRKLVKRWRDDVDSTTLAEFPAKVSDIGDDMVAMLERWLNVGWCWPDACPATICGGPHVKVRYEFDKTVDVIEPIHKVGTTFAETPHHVIT